MKLAMPHIPADAGTSPDGGTPRAARKPLPAGAPRLRDTELGRELIRHERRKERYRAQARMGVDRSIPGGGFLYGNSS